MPPKSTKARDTVTKSQVYRPPISNSSLLFTPDDVIEGFQERIETGIDWTLIESAARHHRRLCTRSEIPTVPFSVALKNKIQNSILAGFFDEKSSISLDQQWEILLPLTLWDNEKFANEEGKICFKNANCVTDNVEQLIKKAVKQQDRSVLKKEFKRVNVLRVNDSEMTDLDEGVKEFEHLVYLNLCGNYIENLDSKLFCHSLRSIELQANCLKSVDGFVEDLPNNLLYLGLARNMLNNGRVEGLGRLPQHILELDLSDNDIYDLEPLLEVLVRLPSLTSLQLAGNPCSVCAAYARTTLSRLPHLKWLDSRKVLPTDRPIDPFEPHADDLRATYFYFTIFRIMSAAQPPKPEKGSVPTFHIELEIPLLDSTRRQFLMFRRYESLTEMLPPPEDEEWTYERSPSNNISKINVEESSSHDTDVYKTLTVKNSRVIHNYTTFESNKVQWSKIMSFQEPAVKIFCPDLTALRDTFRTVITVRLVYTLTVSSKPSKDKKSASAFKPPREQSVVLASMKCALRKPDWSQSSQHFHWDDSLGTDDAIHWGDGDLSVLQYSQSPIKPTKSKQDADTSMSKQSPPDNLTCHFGFGIETLTK